MKLIMSPPSPFARKARVLLRETGLIDRVEEIEISTTPLASDAQILAANPTGKIPALIREDGPAIYDSRVITRQVDDIADAELYPVNSLCEILTLEATADGIMEIAVGMAYDTRFRPDQQSPDWTEAQWGLPPIHTLRRRRPTLSTTRTVPTHLYTTLHIHTHSTPSTL